MHEKGKKQFIMNEMSYLYCVNNFSYKIYSYIKLVYFSKLFKVEFGLLS